MAKCDQGYLCDVCGDEVERVTESSLYLLFVIGELDAEQLHLSPERHLRCHPILAQFIADSRFPPLTVSGDFDKRQLDAEFVMARQTLVTRGYQRLHELPGSGLAITDYPLTEVRAEWLRQSDDDEATS